MPPFKFRKGQSSQSEVCQDPHDPPRENNLFTAWLPAETSPTSTTQTTATAMSSTGEWRSSPSSPPIRGQSLVGTRGGGVAECLKAWGGSSWRWGEGPLELAGAPCLSPHLEVDLVPRKGKSALGSCTAAVAFSTICRSGDRGKTILRLARLNLCGCRCQAPFQRLGTSIYRQTGAGRPWQPKKHSVASSGSRPPKFCRLWPSGQMPSQDKTPDRE